MWSSKLYSLKSTSDVVLTVTSSRPAPSDLDVYWKTDCATYGTKFEHLKGKMTIPAGDESVELKISDQKIRALLMEGYTTGSRAINRQSKRSSSELDNIDQVSLVRMNRMR